MSHLLCAIVQKYNVVHYYKEKYNMSMMKKLFFLVLSFSLMIILFDCKTISGPSGFVDYKITKGLKKSEQSKLNNDRFDKYYEDEYTYDDKGNIIKSKETEYINDNFSKEKKYIVWETEWIVIGENVLPSKASVNGNVFCEIQWDILNTKNKGTLTQDIYSRYYNETQQIGFDSFSKTWYADLDIYPIPFLSDGKFVKSLRTYGYFNYYDKNVLTLGNDNIVLKKYFYSYTKKSQGVQKTFSSSSLLNSLNENRNDVEFNYEWSVIADSVCLNKISFDANFQSDLIDKSKFEIGIKYNEKGQRTEEEWVVVSTENKKEKRISVFKQTLQY
jgi:hypothetical protein